MPEKRALRIAMDEVSGCGLWMNILFHYANVRMLDLLEDFMALREIPYARLDGSTTRPRRTWDIKLVSLLLRSCCKRLFTV